MRMLFF